MEIREKLFLYNLTGIWHWQASGWTVQQTSLQGSESSVTQSVDLFQVHGGRKPYWLQPGETIQNNKPAAAPQ